MAFPAAWPPRVASGIRSIRFYVTGTATANFSDNAYLFVDGVGANPYTPLPQVTGGATAVPATPSGTGAASGGTPPPMVWAQSIRICNDSAAALEYSFDGTNVHGRLLANEQVIYRNRFEAGISVRGSGAFRIEAW